MAGIVPVQYRIHKGERGDFLKQDAPGGWLDRRGRQPGSRPGGHRSSGLQPVEQAEEG